MNSLVKYVEHQIKRGYTPSKIKDILLKYGHNEQNIESAIKKATEDKLPKPVQKIKEDVKPKKKPKRLSDDIFDLIYILIIAFLILFTTGGTTNQFEFVILGFLPTILTVVGTQMLVKSHKENLAIAYALPFIFIGALVGLDYSKVLNNSFEIVKVSALNMILSIMYLFVKSSQNQVKKKPIQKELKELEKEVATANDQEAMHPHKPKAVPHP